MPLKGLSPPTCHQLLLRAAAGSVDLVDDLHLHARGRGPEGGEGGADRVFRGRANFGRVASRRRHDKDADAVRQLRELVLPDADNA